MDTGSNVDSTSISDYNEENWPLVEGIEAKSAFVQAGGPEDHGEKMVWCVCICDLSPRV